ncbi:unnamed protein product [Orchesella dallaii]|uniref:Thioredoxin domain-containing protein n=1 Tax=Orchesella dallaii TaxID=48710 RepID=A0ABP1R125_9HEXA
MISAPIKRFLYSAFFFCLIAIGNTTGGDGEKLKVVELSNHNWELVLNGKWVMIFTDHSACESCSDLQPIWEKFSKWSDGLGIQVGQVEVSNNPTLAGRFMIRSLPQFFYVEDGKFRALKAPLTKADLFLYLERKSWENVEPIPDWKSPSSTLLAVVARLLRMAKYLKNSMNTMRTHYGISTPIAYLIIGFEVFIFGFLLGFLMIVLIKLTTPSRKTIPMKLRLK